MSLDNVVIVSTRLSTIWGWSHGRCILSIMHNRSFFPLSTQSYFSALGPRSRPCPGASGSSSPRESQSDQREREREMSLRGRRKEAFQRTLRYFWVHLLGGNFPTVTTASYYWRESYLKYQTLLHCTVCAIESAILWDLYLMLTAMTTPLKVPFKSWLISRSTDAMYWWAAASDVIQVGQSFNGRFARFPHTLV